MTDKELHIFLRIARLLLKIVVECLENRTQKQDK